MSGSDAVSVIAILAVFVVISKFFWDFVEARAARRANASVETTGQSTGVRGKITFCKDGRTAITLTKDADASTFMHESAHHWLEQLLTDAEHPLAPDVLKADADTVRKWLRAKSNDDIIYNGANEKCRAAATERHEKFARGFERYLMEGVAPSRTLAPTFAKFKQWMTDIYKTVDSLDVPLDDNIRRVFDRMLSLEPQHTPPKQTTQPSHQPIIRDYRAFMERTPSLPTRIEDVSALPYPKELILEALLLEIGREQLQDIEATMYVAAISLAQYQVGVGAKPLEMLGIDISKFPRTNDLKKLREQAKMFMDTQSRTKERFDHFNRLVEEDLRNITSKIAAAKSRRQRSGECSRGIP
jgi:hypothetical protein